MCFWSWIAAGVLKLPEKREQAAAAAAIAATDEAGVDVEVIEDANCRFVDEVVAEEGEWDDELLEDGFVDALNQMFNEAVMDAELDR